MHFTQLLLTLSSLTSIISAAPYVPVNGELQRNRRRWIDYPIPSAETPLPDMPLRKRSYRKRDVPYSVVPVNGAAPSAAVATTVTEVEQGTTVVKTLLTTQAAVTVTPSPSVKTVVYTSVITEHTPEETILITTTMAITEAITAPTPAPVTVQNTQIQTEVSVSVSTAEVTKTAVVTPSPTSTKYYDNGMWHTSYPVKSWETSATSAPTLATSAPYPSSSAGIEAQVQGAAAPTGVIGSYRKLKRSLKPRTAIPRAPTEERAPRLEFTRAEIKGLRKFAAE